MLSEAIKLCLLITDLFMKSLKLLTLIPSIPTEGHLITCQYSIHSVSISLKTRQSLEKNVNIKSSSIHACGYFPTVTGRNSYIST